MNRPALLMMDLLRGLYWVDEALQNGLRRHGWPNVSRSQSLILLNVAFGVHRASALAENLGISRQAISQMLSEMQKAGMIEMRPDPDDGRAQIVVFSSQSSALRSDAMAILEKIETTLAERLGKRRLSQMRETLARDWGEPPQIA